MWTKVDVTKPQPQKNSLEHRVLPMELKLGDRLTDETGEYETIGRPYTTNAGKTLTFGSSASITPRSP
jgi:hypothetical protein